MAAMVDAWWTDTRIHSVDAVRMLASRRTDVEVLNHLARSRMQAERSPLWTHVGNPDRNNVSDRRSDRDADQLVCPQ